MRQAAFINTVATIAKIIPILVFIVIVAAAFKADLFRLDFWGTSEPSVAAILNQVRGTMLVTVFVFVGIEGASVYSRYARRREDVGIATISGFLGVLALMVLVTLLSYGVLTQSELAGLRNPSMAGVLQAVVGPWGAIFVSAGLIVSVSGAYLSWSLLAAEVLWSAARTGTMPSFLQHENRNQVPASALWLTNGLIQIFLILTLFFDQAFLMALKLTGSMILVPYLLVAAYALKLAWTGETYAAADNRRADFILAALATLYAVGLIYAGGLKFLLLSTAIYAPGTVLYIIARREQRARLFTHREAIGFGLLLTCCIAVAYGLTVGAVAI